MSAGGKDDGGETFEERALPAELRQRGLPRFGPEDRKYLLALTMLPGMTRNRMGRLLAVSSGSAGLWETVNRGSVPPVISPAIANTWKLRSREIDPMEVERDLIRDGTRMVALGESEYPLRLAEIYDPPWVLFCRGEGSIPCDRCVAVVGSRKATSYGLSVGERLGGELAERGIVVVSGAAVGVDSAAHRGALERRGSTAAVLGCGPDVIYPRRNGGLLEEIRNTGVILSEYPPGTGAAPYHFPARNRIIAGLCDGVVVVEAGTRSGALITADFALEEGREVFAVPGSIYSPKSRGCHRLISDGAVLVESADDVLRNVDGNGRGVLPGGTDRQLPHSARAGTGDRERPTGDQQAGLSGVEVEILRTIGSGTLLPEEISRECGLHVHDVMAILTRMEVSGIVRIEHGGRFAASLIPE